MKTLNLQKKSSLNSLIVDLPSSKSISNRALIISELAKNEFSLKNLSEARDTQTMLRLLSSKDSTLDVLDAGTTMRFLCAYYSISNQKRILTGTERMQQRPIKILVEALREIGAEINYLKNEGYPPISIEPFVDQAKNKISIRGDVSSQYISALLMIAPSLPEGLILTLEGQLGSVPYIEMTLAIMKNFGINYAWNENRISIPHQTYSSASLTVEPDWSAASYWYSFVALTAKGSAFIKDIKKESLQGDSVIREIMPKLGVKTTFESEGGLLEKCEFEKSFSYNFSQCPDLAQTIAVICAVKGITCTMTGLESLKIKETDRVAALQNELAKLGARLEEKGDHWIIYPSDNLPENVTIETYDDHRMAMAFAPLLTHCNVTIQNPDVVNKSYPSFWKVMENNKML